MQANHVVDLLANHTLILPTGIHVFNNSRQVVSTSYGRIVLEFLF
jgi:hypothetical protein